MSFEAAVLRGGLLLGLVHEREVPEWAMSVLGVSPALDAALAEACVAPVELSAMRECLYPLTRDADLAAVAGALLTMCAVDPGNAGRTVADRVQQLQWLRVEFRLTGDLASGIQHFTARMFATSEDAAANPGAGPATAEELSHWLDGVRQRGSFRVDFATDEEAASFMRALSQAIARAERDGVQPSRGPDVRPLAWLSRDSDDNADADTDASVHANANASPGAGAHILLNEAAWLIAMRALPPLPVGSRIPVAPSSVPLR